jgi:hypothetical protein
MDLAELAYRFRQQEEFAAEYSPLYACAFRTLAEWLEEGADHPLLDWLAGASHGRNPFDVTLLLLAGLHRDILNGEFGMASLADYYPTAGGNLPCKKTEFAPVLREAIMVRRDSLEAFIQTATVQTNETGRGVVWLLPLHYTGWDAIHLSDLGASAGLNLAADQRAYRLVAEDDPSAARFLLDVGEGRPIQFLIQCRGKVGPWLESTSRLPRIISRTGNDLAPYLLETSADELMLSAFVWGDQLQRLQRLQEGIAAFHTVNQGDVSVQLHATNLPDELPVFLDQDIPQEPQIPVVIYNTYMTIYLPDKGSDMRRHIQTWAAVQKRPVLWLQWEPAGNGSKPPEFGWCSWSADLWWGGEHRQWQLAWVQPHGTHIQWEPGLKEWIDFWHGE